MGLLGKTWSRLKNAAGSDKADIGKPDWLSGGAVQGYMKGGIPGAIAGHYAGKEQDRAEQIQQAAMQDAIQRQDQLRREMEARRERDLANTMGFYTPALQSLEHLYGIPMSAWGQGLPANRPVTPPRQGFVNGMPAQAAPLRPEFQGMAKPLGGMNAPLPPGVTSMPMRPQFADMFQQGRRFG